MLLDAGLSPRSAWEAVAEESKDSRVTRVARLLATGADLSSGVVAALAGSPLAVIAVAWLVAAEVGAPLGAAARGISELFRERAQTARDIDVAVSGPRATARLVSGLPLAGLAMGWLMGVDVLGVLLGSPAGLGLLAAGGALGIAGHLWSRSQVRRALPGDESVGVYADLLAVALRGGMSIGRARALVTASAEAARIVLPEPAGVEGVLRLAERTGAPAAELLEAAGRRDRRHRRAEGARSAGVLGVRLLAPVGLCVLPSFIAWGIAPVILGLLSSTGSVA